MIVKFDMIDILQYFFMREKEARGGYVFTV